jgi:hypothetical protein
MDFDLVTYMHILLFFIVLAAVGAAFAALAEYRSDLVREWEMRTASRLRELNPF